MKIEIEHPGVVYGVGQRANNEDRFFPSETAQTSENRLFMVCDGVGGSERGEVASEIVCASVPEYFELNQVAVSTVETIHDAFGFAQSRINAFAAEHPGSNGMATTLTLLHLHEKGATVAHIGDSRVYHIRDGEIIWKTTDHSYVNELVTAGVITEVEARSHPRRNVITRAIQAGDSNVAADVRLIENMVAGDYLFLCTDGIMEGITEEKLCQILFMTSPDTEKLGILNKCCSTSSNDNFTGYLIKIKSVETLNLQLLDHTEGQKTNRNNELRELEKNDWFSKNGIWLIVILLGVAGWFLLAKNKSKPLPKPKEQITSVMPDSVPAVKSTVLMEKKKKIKKNSESR
jgi:PPM family protein phosphatase